MPGIVIVNPSKYYFVVLIVARSIDMFAPFYFAVCRVLADDVCKNEWLSFRNFIVLDIFHSAQLPMRPCVVPNQLNLLLCLDQNLLWPIELF